MAGSFAVLRSMVTRTGGPFFAWWGHELAALFRPVAETLVGPVTRVVIARTERGFTAHLETATTREPLLDGLSVATVDEILAAGVARRTNGTVTLRLAGADCFTRTVPLPSAAGGEAGRILELDLFRSTPFRRGDVLTASRPASGRDALGRVLHRQFVVKRAIVQPIIAACSRSGVTVAAIDCEGAEGAVNFLALEQGRAKPSSFPLLPVAEASGALLIAAALAIDISRHMAAVSALDEDVAGARKAAGTVRAALDTSGAAVETVARVLRAQRQAIPKSAVIEDLSQLLPDDVWLSDLRIDDDQIEMSGYARSGAALIALLERSRFVIDPALSAAVSFDAREQRERFTIRGRIADRDARQLADQGGG